MKHFIQGLSDERRAFLIREGVARMHLADDIYTVYLQGGDHDPGAVDAVRAACLAGFGFALEDARVQDLGSLAAAKADARGPSPAPVVPAAAAAAPAPAEPAGKGDLTAEDLATQLKAMGFRASDGKPGLWSKLDGRTRLCWDYRESPKGRFYGFADDKALSEEQAHARPEYRQMRLLQDRAQSTLPTTPPPTGGKAVLPTNLPAADLKRLWVFIDTPKFRDALRGWRFQPAGEGWWWADLVHEAVQARVAWAKLNKVPWWLSSGEHDLPMGTPAPPKGVA